MLSYNMLIDGKEAVADEVFDIINPATCGVIARCQVGGPAHVDQAAKAARYAFNEWRNLSSKERGRKLLEIAEALEAKSSELMQLVTAESGKPMEGLNGVGSGMEVAGAIAWTRYTANLELPVEVVQDNEEAKIELHRKPLGVVASITPWNWPLLIAVWHIMPALKTGNTVVIKPSPLTPLSTVRLVEIANEILPAGVLNVVTGEGDVGEAMSKHQGIDKIIFTGSTSTGKKIMEASACNLKRLTLELGGNDAGIVLPGTDISKFAENIFGVSFHNNGQTCAALKRLYVHESQYDDVCQALGRIADEVVVGDGSSATVQLGPLQNINQLETVKELVEDARRNGATIISGGSCILGHGFFFKPTIVKDIVNGVRLVDEEQFGPVLPVIKYSSLDEAINMANDTSSGLGGSVWGADIDEALKVAGKLECGSVWINDHGSLQPDVPFGGVKQSGVGVGFGRLGMEEYVSIQTVRVPK